MVVAVLTVPDRLLQIAAAATKNARSDALMDFFGFTRKPALDDRS